MIVIFGSLNSLVVIKNVWLNQETNSAWSHVFLNRNDDLHFPWAEQAKYAKDSE